MAYKLSVIVPARNEEWLGNTINDVLSATGDETEVIAVLDGQLPVHPIDDHPRLTLINNPVSIGQRASINLGARVSRADYVCKLDAHCRVGQDFGNVLIRDYEPRTIVIPRMHALHVFDWKCRNCGIRTYQGPKPKSCNTCKVDRGFKRVVVWQPRTSSNKTFDHMRFDETLKFGYWQSFRDRPEGQGQIADTLSLLGACFFTSREHYWAVDGCDEQTGSWGQQGTEMACKAHLYEGGRLRVNKNAWFAHLFRTAAGFSFPYHMSHGQTEAARTHSRDLWLNNKWPKAARPLSALLDQFWPIPGWSDDALSKLKDGEKGRKQWHVPAVVEPLANPRYIKSAPDSGLTYGIVYYTENRCPEPIFSTVQEQLKRCVNGNQIASVSLKPIDFGDNVVLNLERGYRTMFEQILTGLANLDTDFAFLCEHDVLYSPEHFKFIPPRRNVYYYNEHVYLVSAQTGQSLYYEHRSVSQLVADRRLLLDHYRERLARIEKEGFSYRNGFEPGTRKLASGGYDNFPAHSFFSSRPNVDIRDTGVNLTKTLWHREQFRNQKFTVGWTLGGTIPTWGHTEGRFNDWLAEVRAGGK